MKITCDSCGSKYTIADAKVKGRKVKVRCKGCKESILVDGTKLDESSADKASDDDSNSEATPAADKETNAPAEDAPKKDKNLWSVNLTDDDSRDMTLEELITGWKSGLVTPDAYVWKDGMGDWKPILEVGELKLKLGAPPEKKAAGVVSSAAAPAAAAAKSEDKVDDLFGGVDLAGDEPSEAEKPTTGTGGGKPTGARNDSSVLFSLDSLNAGGNEKKDKTDSVDLFGNLNSGGPQLTNSADLLTAPAKDPPPAPAGARAATGAPVQQKGKGGMIAAIVVVLAVLGGGAVFLMGGSEDKAAAEDPAALAAKAKAEKEAEEARREAEEERKKLAAELKKMQDELKKAREEATEKGEDPEEAEAKKKAELEEAKKEEEAKKQASTSSSSSSSSSSKSTGSSSSAKPAPSPKPAAAAGGAAFNVGAARAALSAAAANAAACKKPGGPVGSGKVQVTFSTSGRVTSAQVISGPFGGTAVGGCVASTFRRARVPAFGGSPQTVAKSFRIP